MNVNKISAEEIAVNMGYSYLAAGRGKWQDGKDTIHDIKLMDRKYVNNCKEFIKRGIAELNQNDALEAIKHGVYRKSKRYKPSEKDLEYLRKEIISVLKNKLSEF